MSVYRIDLAYDGSGFRGYAVQPNVRTVQAELDRGLRYRIPGVDTVVAGRTDAGVHAHGQVVSFETDQPVDTVRLRRSLNKMLNPEIAIKSITAAPDDFNARFSATSRTYKYRIDRGDVMDPRWRHYAWRVGYLLDLEKMVAASQHFLGTHDFTSFCRLAARRSPVREVRSVEWREIDQGILEFEVTASSFCHQQVRSLVAVCVDVGRGRVAPDSIPTMMTARDRSLASGAAPAHGLTLWNVGYGDVESG